MISNLEYNSLIWFIIRSGYIGLSISNIIITSKQNSWISCILALIIGIIPLLLFLYLRKKSHLSILEYNDLLFKKKSKYINITLGLGILFYVIINFWNLVYFVQTQFLFKTKYIYIIICFIIPILYGSIMGIKSIARSSLLFLYLTILTIIIIILGIYSNVSLENIEPIVLFNNNILYGSIILVSYNILPLFMLLFINKKNIKKYNSHLSIIMYILSILSIIIGVFLTISCLGGDWASFYNYPEFHVLKKVKIGGFVDRLENILSWEWIISIFIICMLGINFTSNIIKKELNIKKTNIVKFVLCCLIILICELLFKVNIDINSYSKNIFIIIMTLIFFIIPLIIFIKSLLQKMQSNQSTSYYSSNN